jgi:hypothetical protein
MPLRIGFPAAQVVGSRTNAPFTLTRLRILTPLATPSALALTLEHGFPKEISPTGAELAGTVRIAEVTFSLHQTKRETRKLGGRSGFKLREGTFSKMGQAAGINRSGSCTDSRLDRQRIPAHCGIGRGEAIPQEMDQSKTPDGLGAQPNTRVDRQARQPKET